MCPSLSSRSPTPRRGSTCGRSCATGRCIARFTQSASRRLEEAIVRSRPGVYDVEGNRQARMAKLADAADLKSADRNWSWGFKSPSGHHLTYLFSCSLPYSRHIAAGGKLAGSPRRPSSRITRRSSVCCCFVKFIVYRSLQPVSIPIMHTRSEEHTSELQSRQY